jgi:hypothetical protein
MGIGLSYVTTVHSINPNRCRFIGGSDARIIVSRDEAARIQLWTDDHSRVPAAKSPTAQAQFLRPIRGKYSRASHKQRQGAAKSTTFMTGIRAFMKACAILWQKFYVCLSEIGFRQGNRLLDFRVATHLGIRDRVSMKTGRLGQVQNRPIERGPSDLVQLPRARKCAHLTCDKVTTIFTTSRNQGGIQ